jgi:MoaA/NifB/PqqE/SkfB family radical SAM enzyme
MQFKNLKILDSQNTKVVISSDYNMLFKKFNSRGEPDGQLLRWGKTIEDDPLWGPSPEIADIEISAGKCSSNCPWCYKNNTLDKPLVNMSLEIYKKVLDKLCGESSCLSQVALGLTSVRDNPDLIEILKYTLSKGCFPNFTISGSDKTLDLDIAQDLAELCGALAVSVTPWNYEEGLDTIKLFTSLGVQQTNIHVVVSESSIPFVHKVLDARKDDPRLKDMGAIVCLMIKPKGRAKGKFNPPTQEQYEGIVHRALKENIPIGFDSCGCHRFLEAVDKANIPEDHKKVLQMNSDPCESFCFSIYVNTFGEVVPCSFCEGEEGYESINILEAEDFVKDVWMSPMAQQFRKTLISRERSCPAFPEIDKCLI